MGGLRHANFQCYHQSPAGLRIRMRKKVFLGLSLVVLFGSFFTTLWLTGTATPPSTTDERSSAEQLASRSISNRSDLIEAAVAVGLHLYNSNEREH